MQKDEQKQDTPHDTEFNRTTTAIFVNGLETDNNAYDDDNDNDIVDDIDDDDDDDNK